MNKKGSFVLVTTLFLLGFFLINHFPYGGNSSAIKSVEIAGQSIKVELAITNAERELGLSGRSGLKEDEGMLFVFPQPGNYPFWMKDMNFPIDIIWISEEGKIVYLKKDARPQSYPGIFGPDEQVKYVLEVVSGFSDKFNLKVGDRVQFTY
ncbi:hypothetical protein A2917_00320 [Candidatus Nomurabacteria bacterium RIFCSPLOWO2_01_FULL_42_17]|uniref:DUF192 domain-containing protein n=1 Tax=Candidatus Nomurabacteria bacterium RIFCSPLOWO2_01_FULL_42_17 TaxID=1801780 RepID=A0A1F6XNM4_9BACT|nr:MAG: hypothetical protein A2917_00320 [Candidatus Nomurabacteria bacterium RIFCSPLOWO2_01_FULL_42_17]